MISNIIAAFHREFEMVKLFHMFQGHMHALPPVQFGLFVCPNQHSGRLSFGTSNENISNNLFARYAGVSTSSSVQNLPRTSDKVYYHQRF